MRLFENIIPERRGEGWLKASVLLWCAGLCMLAADFWLRLNSPGYREWRLSRLSNDGMCCMDQFDSGSAMDLFWMISGTSAVCLVVMLAVAMLVGWLNRVSKDIGVIIASLYSFAAVLLIADAVNSFDKGLFVLSPDFGTLGFAALFAAIAAGAAGILLISLNKGEAAACSDSSPTTY